jgi:DNA-binding NarL/FixJ family response regulator
VAHRVLVVDDEQDIRDLLEMLLRDDPRCTAVASAGDLDEAIPTARAFAPDAVIVDLMFGHRTCAEILPALRAAVPEAHIVVFTSSRRTAMSLGVLDLGADVVVQKVSVSFDELIGIALDAPLRLDPTDVAGPADRPRRY